MYSHTVKTKPMLLQSILLIIGFTVLAQSSMCHNWCANPNPVCDAICGDISNHSEHIHNLTSKLEVAQIELRNVEEMLEEQNLLYKEQYRAWKFTLLLTDQNTSTMHKLRYMQERLDECYDQYHNQTKQDKIPLNIKKISVFYLISIILLCLSLACKWV
jgi:hypothetical protein